MTIKDLDELADILHMTNQLCKSIKQNWIYQKSEDLRRVTEIMKKLEAE